MSVTQKLVECLQELKNLDYSNVTVARASNGKAGKALNLIFEVSRQGIPKRLTEPVKRQIGDLIVDAIKPIKTNIVSTCCRDRSRLDTSVLQKRSALQFLVEDFADFPAKSTTLLKQLEQANIKESIEILDKLIVDWRDISDSDEGKSDPETAADALPGAGQVKAVAHYAAGDNEGGDRAMYQSTRSSAVIVGGAIGGMMGGPAGAIFGAMYSGALTDIFASAAMNESQGTVRHFKNINEDINYDRNPTKSVLGAAAHLGLDAVSGMGMGGGLSSVGSKSVGKFAAKKATETVMKTTVGKTAQQVVFQAAVIAERAAFEKSRQKVQVKRNTEQKSNEKQATKNENDKGKADKGKNSKEGTGQKSSKSESNTGTGSGSQPPEENKYNKKTNDCENQGYITNFLNLLKEVLKSMCGEENQKFFYSAFENLPPEQRKCLKDLIKKLNKFGNLEIVLNLVIRIFEKYFSSNFTFANFIHLMEFVKCYINNEIEKLSISPVPFQQLQTYLITTVTRDPDIVRNIVDTFNDVRAEIESEKSNPNFRDIFTAVYHYIKHKNVPDDGTLSVRKYYVWIRFLLERIRGLPEYSLLVNGALPRNEIVYDLFVAEFGRRIRIVVKFQDGKAVVSSCYVVSGIFFDDKEEDAFINGTKQTRKQ